LAAAFEAVAEAEAIILDVSNCPGGGGGALLDLSAVFLEPGTVLMETEIRGRGREPMRVPDDAPVAPRQLDIPLYIAATGRTGSACEELAFDLKHLGRATVVGERTAGAGHGLVNTGLTPVGLGLSAFIPNMRAHHTAYPSGFEGTGVLPDISAPAASAIDIARLQALEEIGRSLHGPELSALRATQAEATQAWLTAQRERVSASRDWWRLVGIYGDRVAVAVIDAELILISRTGRHTPLQSVGDDEFLLQGPSFGPAAGNRRVVFDVSGSEPVITINQADGSRLTLTRGDSYYLKDWIG
jgi:Peptidase family S41